MITVSLYRAAHGRTGDKGNRSNISVIAWHPDLWTLLVDQVTESRVAERFASRRPTMVRRYLLPQLHAMNFVLDGVLDGTTRQAASAAVNPCPASAVPLGRARVIASLNECRCIPSKELDQVRP
jgi:hypothetical protein